MPKYAVHELTKAYRSRNEHLQVIGDKVRNCEDDILEYLTKYEYTTRLNESILSRECNDEIILCLNYDGLYGINNINRFLQNSNPNPSFEWGIGTYKVGDPILFNEFSKFSRILYNNLKIYWSPESEKKIIGEMKKDFNERDTGIIKYKMAAK